MSVAAPRGAACGRSNQRGVWTLMMKRPAQRAAQCFLRSGCASHSIPTHANLAGVAPTCTKAEQPAGERRLATAAPLACTAPRRQPRTLAAVQWQEGGHCAIAAEGLCVAVDGRVCRPQCGTKDKCPPPGTGLWSRSAPGLDAPFVFLAGFSQLGPSSAGRARLLRKHQFQRVSDSVVVFHPAARGPGSGARHPCCFPPDSQPTNARSGHKAPTEQRAKTHRRTRSRAGAHPL